MKKNNHTHKTMDFNVTAGDFTSQHKELSLIFASLKTIFLFIINIQKEGDYCLSILLSKC